MESVPDMLFKTGRIVVSNGA